MRAAHHSLLIAASLAAAMLMSVSAQVMSVSAVATGPQSLRCCSMVPAQPVNAVPVSMASCYCLGLDSAACQGGMPSDEPACTCSATAPILHDHSSSAARWPAGHGTGHAAPAPKPTPGSQCAVLPVRCAASALCCQCAVLPVRCAASALCCRKQCCHVAGCTQGIHPI
jgi:hypothetical protein